MVFISVMSNTEDGVSVRLVILNQMHMKAKLRPFYMLKRLSPANDALRRNPNFVACVRSVFMYSANYMVALPSS